MSSQINKASRSRVFYAGRVEGGESAAGMQLYPDAQTRAEYTLAGRPIDPSIKYDVYLTGMRWLPVDRNDPSKGTVNYFAGILRGETSALDTRFSLLVDPSTLPSDNFERGQMVADTIDQVLGRTGVTIFVS